MRISHKHKFVFIAVPKTGSSTIRACLDKFSDITGVDRGIGKDHYYHHTTASELKKHFDKQNWNWDEYFKFAFVRNPWSRVVSQWEYYIKIVNGVENGKCDVNENFFKSCKKLLTQFNFNFNNFILYLSKEECLKTTTRQYTNQIDWTLNNEKEESILNFVGKTENLQEDFNTICDKIGIPRKQLPHKNSTKHKHYTEYYDDETREIIAKKYAKDIEYFGYKFGE